MTWSAARNAVTRNTAKFWGSSRTQLSTLPAAAPDPSAKARLEEIRDNLLARIAEAESHRWYGEAEGLRVSLVGANTKLAQMDQISANRTKTVQLGIPSFTDTAGRTTDSADDRNQF